MTVHSQRVESFEGLLQRCRRGRGCSELLKNTIFPEQPVQRVLKRHDQRHLQYHHQAGCLPRFWSPSPLEGHRWQGKAGLALQLHCQGRGHGCQLHYRPQDQGCQLLSWSAIFESPRLPVKQKLSIYNGYRLFIIIYDQETNLTTSSRDACRTAFKHF